MCLQSEDDRNEEFSLNNLQRNLRDLQKKRDPEGGDQSHSNYGERDDSTTGYYSIRCGEFVDATICPNGHRYGPVEGKRELGYSCLMSGDSATGVPERGIKISASQQVTKVERKLNNDSSVLLSLHPWDTKSTPYLRLSRNSKSSIVWDKILED